MSRKKTKVEYTSSPKLCMVCQVSTRIQGVFFIPSFVLSFSDDDDVFWIIRPFFMMMVFILFSFQKILPAGADPASKLDDTFVDLNDIETIVMNRF